MPSDPDDYAPGPDAPARLLLHCAQKSAQVGAIGGVALAAVGAARGGGGRPALARLAAALVVGTAALTAASAAKIATLDEEGIRDRVYRLHYNAGQARTDRFAAAGGAAGAAAALLARRPPGVGGVTAALGGAAAGVAAGVAAHVATHRKED